MRVVLTGHWGRGHRTNSPMKSRVPATSLARKQPKTHPRVGTRKPVRSNRPVWKSKGLDPLGGCSGFVTEPSRGKAGRQQWVPKSCAIRLIPLGCNRGRGNAPAFKQAYAQRCGNQVNQRRQYVSAEWPLMERGWGLGSGINTLFPKGSHQVKIKRFVGGRDAHETHCSHPCCPVPCGLRDSNSNG